MLLYQHRNKAMREFTKYKFFPFIVVAIGFSVCAWYGINFGFGAQCDRAGYTGAEKEACVIRINSGGPVYIENIGN